MTVSELAQKCGFDVLAMPEPDRVVKGAYIGDLLSWAMGRASEGNAWITIMTNVNTLAVASLTDVACIILAEGVTFDSTLIDKAKEEGIAVYKTDLPIFDAALLVNNSL